MEHAWCRDVARDAAVRAAEDGRTGPLPTLTEAIAAPFACTACGGFGMDHRCKESCDECEWTPQTSDGMRTERITLEVTHDLEARLSDWIVEVIDESLGLMESVRVVHEPKLAPHANAGGEANHAAQAASGGGEGPRGWLSDKERHWISYCRDNYPIPYAALQCLDALLGRSSPPEVVLPKLHTRCEVNEANHKSPCLWFRRPDVIEALAAAGVAVKEVGRE